MERPSAWAFSIAATFASNLWMTAASIKGAAISTAQTSSLSATSHNSRKVTPCISKAREPRGARSS